MPKQDTRTRILLTSLQLFNEFGEPNTTTNDIADETDISPGNLHYHFRRKSDLIDALLAEFQADARKLLVAPNDATDAIDDFWGFVHLLLETLAAYRFLYRDIETLRTAYPQVARAQSGFAKALLATTELHLRSLKRSGVLRIEDSTIPEVCRNLAVIALFSERFDKLSGTAAESDVTALRIARAVLSVVLPYATPEAAPFLQAITEQYRN